MPAVQVDGRCEAPDCVQLAPLRCGGCVELRYCSSICAARGWVLHRESCQAAATLAGGGFAASENAAREGPIDIHVTEHFSISAASVPPAPVPARAGALTAPSAADVLSGLVARGRGAATARTLLRAASAAGCVTDACVFAAAELRRAGAAGELLGPDDRSAVAAAYRAALRPLRETLSLCEAVAAGRA